MPSIVTPQIAGLLDLLREGSVNVALEETMPDRIPVPLAGVPELSRAELCDLWKQLFNASPDPRLRRDLMIPILAYRIQETFGSLKANIKNRLRQLAEGFARDPDQAVSSKATLKPGTRLVRDWRDQVHLVNVEVDGYEYKGGRYKSLSQIARLITGTRWSGPLFFGIKNGQTGNELKETR
jgi:hypothetical protein